MKPIYRYLGKCSFDGSSFFGWNIQQNKPTIQGKIQTALKRIFKQNIKIYGVSRTDRGVHALIYYFHFDLNHKIKNVSLVVKTVNDLLNPAIKLFSLEKTELNFHARYSIKQKTYMYKFLYEEDMFKAKYNYFIAKEKVNFDQIKLISLAFLGEHDFANFATSMKLKTNTIRKIDQIEIANSLEGFTIMITAKGFLHNMVRKIFHFIIFNSQNEHWKDDLKKYFESNNYKYCLKLPPNGLYLTTLKY